MQPDRSPSTVSCGSRCISLCYHDVLSRNDGSASGFSGADADSYKLDEADFCKHMDAIACAAARDNGTQTKREYVVRLTFDDGGASACRIADILDSYRWRGYFFIPTDYIGRPAFLTRRQILELRSRGHFIGSHGSSHRGRMSSMSREALAREWGTSALILSELLGECITTASVPSGYYCRQVAEMAAAAGVKLLFTLEPTSRIHIVDGCMVTGRYMLRRHSSAEYAALIAAGKLAPRLRQQVSWTAKKVLKAAPFYSRLRKLYFAG
jgi:peptidoglycan/xylan/chitin deacetylase (PgdA/CDA1 family)